MGPEDIAHALLGEPVREVEAPSFTAITLKTGSGWTEGAAVCSVCTAVVLDREKHLRWHSQFTHIIHP